MYRSALLLSLFLVACSSQRDRITAQGTIEVDETDVIPTVRGRITRILVAEGDYVKAGDTMVTLESSTLPEDLAERRARVARAEAELRDLELGSRPEEIARAEAVLESAVAEDLRAARDLDRMEQLGVVDAVSQQDVDEARAKAGEARGRKDAAELPQRLVLAGANREVMR